MAKVKEISVGAQYLKSLPNFENIRFEASVSMTVEDGESEKEVYNKAWGIVGEQINNQLKLFEEKKGVKKGLR